jgi:hypothetical protein
LFLIDRILKFEEKLFNGVDSIRSHGVGKHHVVHFRVEFSCGSASKDNCD